MSINSFYDFLYILEPQLPSTREDSYNSGIILNGPISKISCLSRALWCFASGDLVDISDDHVVSIVDPLNSLWLIVDDIHNFLQFDMLFTAYHTEKSYIGEEIKIK